VRKRENRGGGVVYFNEGEFGGQMSRITGDLELGGNDVCPPSNRQEVFIVKDHRV